MTPAQVLAELSRVEAELASTVPEAKRLQREANATYARVRVLSGERDVLLGEASALLAA